MNLRLAFMCLTVQLFLLQSCNNNTTLAPSVNPYTIDSTINYSFFVAGHTYGNPMNFQYGLHPPFKTLTPEINNYPKLEMGILTGDIVPKPTQDYWDSALQDMSRFSVPLHVAPGNHDKGPIFEEHFEDYYSFNKTNDLFLILSPRNWNIDGEQLNMVKSKIDSCKSQVDNIFIFCHELIWWTPENEFKDVEINYRPHYPGSTTYWQDLQPYLDSLEVPVYLFAGDIGSSDQVSPYMYEKQGNVSYFASGMGSNINDNVLFVEVSDQGHVTIKMIGVKNHLFGIIRTF